MATKKVSKPRKRSKKSDIDPLEVMDAFLQGLHLFLCENPPISQIEREEAQDLFDAAAEAATFEDAEELFQKGLALDPMNVDALLTMAENIPLLDRQAIEAYRMITSIAARRIGTACLKKEKGNFWGLVETRPYMRARESLATSLREAGRLEEAVEEYESLLELNPEDNQGMRYLLLPCYLIMNRLSEARGLFTRYEGEDKFNAVFSWGRVLEQFLSENIKGAAKALSYARKQNPHMEGYITGKSKLPDEIPGMYHPGGEDEAAAYADEMHDAWRPYPTALEWLREQR